MKNTKLLAEWLLPPAEQRLDKNVEAPIKLPDNIFDGYTVNELSKHLHLDYSWIDLFLFKILKESYEQQLTRNETGNTSELEIAVLQQCNSSPQMSPQVPTL